MRHACPAANTRKRREFSGAALNSCGLDSMASPRIGMPAAFVTTGTILFATYQAEAVLAPLTAGLFLLAVLWPVQHWLSLRISAFIALAITVVATSVVGLAFASLIAWGFTRVGQSVVADAARYQALYDTAVSWLDQRGVSIAHVWADSINMSRILGLAHRVTSRLNTTLSFWLITLLYVVLELMEVGALRYKIQTLIEPVTAAKLLSATSHSAHKLRRYLGVRTLMSLTTGSLIGLFAWAVDLQFPVEWAVIAFTLNYIPFIGSFVATLLPTLFEVAQATAWQSVVGIFVCLNVIQFVGGGYIEPRLAGAVLSVSPLLVLFATFFWSYMWGLYGAFIGVPITIVVLTFCSHFEASRLIAEMLGGPLQEAP
jgi:AI-2 transport protein TqsA